MEANLKRIIKLIQKTGDKLIIADSNFELPYVIMPFVDYEKMMTRASSAISELSESELLDKINRDIASWKINKEEDFCAEAEDDEEEVWQNDLAEKMKDGASTTEEKKEEKKEVEKAKDESKEDLYYFEPLES